LLDRAHEMPPQLIAPLVAEEVRAIGGRDVSILLQDYAQLTLVPLPGRGLTDGEPLPLEGSPVGRALLSETIVEQRQAAAGMGQRRPPRTPADPGPQGHRHAGRPRHAARRLRRLDAPDQPPTVPAR
jgi:hypothetical protein